MELFAIRGATFYTAPMTWFATILLGVIEGLTEFIPVSSTGHLIIAKKAAGLHGVGIDSFLVVVQLGALCAAIFYYRATIWKLISGMIGGEPDSRKLFVRLLLASIPLLLLGYAFGSQIKARLFSPYFVAIALILGACAMMLTEWVYKKNISCISLQQLSVRSSCMIGVIQAAALLPGTSRSMSCIIAGQLARLDRVSAADFAFLLAIPTLGAATLYEMFHSRHELITQVGISHIILGLIISFMVGLGVISFFLKYLKKYSLIPFAIYRIVLGCSVVIVERFL